MVKRILLPTLGYGNGLTLTRGLAICLLAGFLFSPRPPGLLAWVPALLYTLSSIIDYLDGYVARVTGHSTVLGEILDMEFDGLGMLVAITVAIQYGQLPWWYLILGLGRQLFIGGIWLRNRLHKPIYEMTPSENRRLIAGFQMGFMTVILWPIFSPPTTTLACVLFSIPLAGSFTPRLARGERCTTPRIAQLSARTGASSSKWWKIGCHWGLRLIGSRCGRCATCGSMADLCGVARIFADSRAILISLAIDHLERIESTGDRAFSYSASWGG